MTRVAKMAGVIHAATMMFGIRVALWCIPYPAVRGYLERRRDRRMRRPPIGERVDPARIARRVGLASAVIPRSTCLVRALVAEQLLAEAGLESVLRLGVANTSGAGLSAHAWIEHGGRVLVGGDISPFTAFEPTDRGKRS
ncbi:MAG: lasso peptide biosynthesis B2 protein [bacterium]